jgi:hypothetical protein
MRIGPRLLLPVVLLGRFSSAQLPSNKVPQQFRTASRALITENVDRTRMVTTLGAVHTDVASSKDLGEADGKTVMDHIQLILRRPAERQAAFDAEVESLHTPGSVNFHQWLTPETIGEEFSPAPSDIATVIAYLHGEGFTVNRTGKSGMYVDFTGTAAQVEHSFHTAVHNVLTPSGETRYAAVVPAQIPEALAPAVAGFVSLSNIAPHPQVAHAMPSVVPATPAYTPSSGVYYLGAQDFYTVYNETPLLTQTNPINGNGITVALLEETDITTADVTYFRTTFGVSPASPSLTVSHGSASVSCSDPGVTSKSEETEAILDAEWAGATAPSATLLYMSCATGSSGGIFLSAEAVIDNNLAPIMSLSYGLTETGNSSLSSFMVNLWEQAAAQGQTVVVSSGDSGSAPSTDQNTNAPASHGTVTNVFASTAYNVSAGGTDFQDAYNDTQADSSYGQAQYWNSTNGTGDSSAKSYIPETTWNGTCASSIITYYKESSTTPNALCDDNTKNSGFLTTVGAGGGVSLWNPRPSWQSGTVYGLPAAAGIYNSRLQPDISLFASNGIWGHALEYYQSDVSASLQIAGGTSFVAPQLAGVFALIAQSTGQKLGQPDYELYTLAGTAYGTTSYTPGTTCNGSGTTSNTGTTSSSPASSCVFYDITTSNNSQVCTAGTANCYNTPSDTTYGILSTSTTSALPAYASGTGYDLSTGIGSLNITKLVAAWSNPAVTSATPTVTLVPVPNPTVYGGNTLNVTTTVSGTNNGFSPTGTFVYTASGSNFGPYALTANNCTGSTCTSSGTIGLTYGGVLPTGYISVSSAYTSNSQYYGNASGSASVVIAKQTPTVTVSSVTTSAASATLTASVAYTGSGSAPSGTLSFVVGSNSRVNAACSGSSSPLSCTASYSTAGLAGGANTITATIATDTNYNTASGINTLTYNQTFSGIGVSGFTSPAVITEGGTVTVNAFDQNGNVDTVFTGAVTLTSSDAHATLPSAYTFQSSDRGVHAFSVTLNSVGTQSITAASGSISASQTGILVGDAIWVLNAVGTLDKLSRTGSLLSSGVGTGGTAATNGGTAFDSSGYVWSVRSNTNTLYSANPLGSGTASYTGGGLSGPGAVAVDGASHEWVANASGNTVSEFSNAGVALSGSSGFGSSYVSGEALSAPGSIALDFTGGVWVANKGGNSVTHIFGAAAPVTTPLSSATASGTLGTKP